MARGQDQRGGPRHGGEALHSAPPKWPGVCGTKSCWVLAPPFCLGLQGLFNGSRVELQLETLTNPERQLARPQVRLGLEQFQKVPAHFRRQLVGVFWSRLLRQQSFQPAFLEVTLRLVDGRAREAKLGGRAGDRIPLLLQGSQRFVFELEQVTGVEKIRLLKERLAHLRMTGIKRAGGFQGPAFGFGIRLWWHKCKSIYTALCHIFGSCQRKYTEF